MYKRNGTHHSYKLQNPAKTVAQLCSAICGISMTSLLMHTVAHPIRPSYMPKIITSPLKSSVKVVKNGKILTFKVNFLCQKLSESFYFFFQ